MGARALAPMQVRPCWVVGKGLGKFKASDANVFLWKK
jgi:hypothetical protein